MSLISTASTSLRAFFYTFEGDASGVEIRNALIAAAERGVRVSLIIDDFGSLITTDSFFASLRSAGVSFARFQPRLFRKYMLRNHQKMAIADEASAIVGSFNIGDEHLRDCAPDGWRDIGVKVDGPAATRLAVYFDALENWVNTPKNSMRALKKLLADAHETEGDVRWIFGGPTLGYSNYVNEIRNELRKSRRADLIMAYFVPGPIISAAVRRLASAGKFRLIAAEKTDVRLSRAASWHIYRTLLRSGAEIYEYRPKLLHTKLILLENAAFIGSGNFDIRSLYVNLEVMLRVERADFVAELRDFFEAELDDCNRIDLATLRNKRRWYRRIFWRVAYFLLVTVDGFLSNRFAR